MGIELLLNTKLNTIVSNAKFCGICSENNCDLNSLDFCPNVPSWNDNDTIYTTTISYMLEVIFGDKVSNILLNEYVCNACLESVLTSFVFIYNTLHNTRIFEYYLTQLDNQTVDLLNNQQDNINNNAKLLIILENPETIHNVKEKPLPPKKGRRPKNKIIESVYLDNQYDDSWIDESDNNRKTFVCDCCNKVFEKKIKLINHLLRTQKTLIECPICHIVFKGTSVYVKHLATHKAWEKSNCLWCGEQFVKKQEYYSHIKIHKRRNKYDEVYECCVCHKRSKDMISHQAHETIHANDEKPNCLECDMVFDTKDLYDHHLETHKLKDTAYKMPSQKTYECIICHKISEDMRTHRIHKATHNPNEKIKCLKCIMEFDSKNKYYYHLKKSHAHDRKFIKKNYECPICHTMTKDLISYRKHKLTHRAGEKPNCLQCEIEFDNYNAYFYHTRFSLVHRVKHKPLQPTTVTTCNKEKGQMKARNEIRVLSGKRRPDDKNIIRLTKGNTLKKSHPQNVIKNTKKETTEEIQTNTPQKCNYCNKYSTTYPKKLQRHTARCQIKYLSHKCRICNEMFKTRDSLFSHIQNHSINKIHTAKKICCELCGMVLSCSGALRKHVRRRHTGESPYPCDLCGRRFVCINDVKLHKEKLHSEIVVPCPICGSTYRSIHHTRAHVRRVHWKSYKPLDVNKIPQVAELFADRRRVERVDNSTLEETYFPCKLCDQILFTDKALLLHMKNKHYKAIKNYAGFTCPICSKLFFKKVFLQRHIKRIHGSGEGSNVKKARNSNESACPTFASDNGKEEDAEL